MKTVRSKCAGTCYGVARALDIAYDLAESGKQAQTLGPLIHNPGVVAQLSEKGVSVAHDTTEVSAPTVVIRSHGVTPEVRASLERTGAEIVDATCPHVLRAQKAAMKLVEQGCTLVVVGERDHPEVEGICAWARQAQATDPVRIVVVASASELPDDLIRPVGVVAQTTQNAEAFEAVVFELRQRGLDPQVSNTICNATSERQQAAAELSTQVDAMVVVGGRNSSNTKRLFEICREHAPRAFHVESADELDRSDFASCEVVGITAGASTPEEQIAAIEDYLHTW